MCRGRQRHWKADRRGGIAETKAKLERTLLVAPGLTTRTLLGTKGIATRSDQTLLVALIVTPPCWSSSTHQSEERPATLKHRMSAHLRIPVSC